VTEQAGRSAGPSTRTVARVFFTVVGFCLLLYLLYLVRSVVGLILIGVFLSIALGPAVDAMSTRAKLPRGPAILFVFVTLFASIFFVGLLVVPPVVDGVGQLADDVPTYIDDLRSNDTIREYDDKYDITDKLRERADELPARLADAAGALRAVTVGVFSAVIQLVTVLTITFFLLLDGGRIVRWLIDQFSPLRRQRYERIATDVYKSTAGYVAGALTIATICGVSTYIMLSILGVPFAVPLAVLMSFLALIPLIGASIGGFVVALVTLFSDFPQDTVIWVVFLIVYQQLENNVLQPFIYRRAVNLHPLLVIVGILIGSSLLGVLGALVAIPIAAAVQIFVRDWWAFRKGEIELPPQVELEDSSGDILLPPSAAGA
jgi:predicted PurR-regulated permease PerM